MTDAAQIFIESHLDDIDANSWSKVFDDIYDDLDVNTSNSVVESLKEALGIGFIEDYQHEAFWKRFEDIIESYTPQTISMRLILNRYVGNYYGMLTPEARTLLIENPELTWEYKEGEYWLETYAG